MTDRQTDICDSGVTFASHIPGILFVDLIGHDEDCVLNCDEVSEVDHGLVHHGAGGHLVLLQQLHQVVDHELGVVSHRQHGQHNLQPYCKKL